LTNAGVTSQEAAEIATYATYCVLATRIATLVAVPPSPTEKLVGRWFSPMFRVVLELEGRKHRRQIPPQPLPAHAIATPPMSALFRHLDGLPLASLLYRALTESLQSKILPRRTKLLLWAVVARALQCTTCEAGCRTLIAEEGIIEDEFNEVLQRLHSRGLTPLEAKLVPIARETTRYVPAAIQAKIRGLAAEIRDEELVEFVAITALSNAMARLTVVLDCP
jgi:alkylhydroperoxidase family enzyme